MGVFWATALSVLVLHLDKQYLIEVPESPIKHGIVMPDFQGVFTQTKLWAPLGYLVVTLLLIDGTESLATIAAVDRIDPYRRRSDPDRTLLAMGVSNVCSSLVGGLTIIPGIVKSTANVMGRGRTQWANFYNACFLLIFLFLGRDLINMVPKTVLAAILFFVGFKLCRPQVWLHVTSIGMEQFSIFVVTIFVTVTTDLLIGIAAGVALKLLISLWYIGLWHRLSNEDPEANVPCLFARLINLFRDPVTARKYTDGVYHLWVRRPMVCFNLHHTIRELERIPADAREVYLHITEDVTLLDHTTSEVLLYYLETFNVQGEKAKLFLVGLEQMKPLSRYRSSVRLAKVTARS